MLLLLINFCILIQSECNATILNTHYDRGVNILTHFTFGSFYCHYIILLAYCYTSGNTNGQFSYS